MGTILKVPHMEQTDEWPSGDECLCAVMLLRYLGIRISVNEFIDFFLPQGQMRRKEGRMIGPDPENVMFHVKGDQTASEYRSQCDIIYFATAVPEDERD